MQRDVASVGDSGIHSAPWGGEEAYEQQRHLLDMPLLMQHIEWPQHQLTSIVNNITSSSLDSKKFVSLLTIVYVNHELVY